MAITMAMSDYTFNEWIVDCGGESYINSCENKIMSMREITDRMKKEL